MRAVTFVGRCALFSVFVVSFFVVGFAPVAGAQQLKPDEIKIIQKHTIKLEPTTIKVTPSLNLSNQSTKITITSAQQKRQSGPVCGGMQANGKPQPACALQPAKFVSTARGRCPAGSFFDIGKWECYSCPAGYGRTLAAVDTARACSKPNKNIRGEFGAAKFMGRLCPQGSFYDNVRGGECWSCPSGYKRSAAPVGGANACVIPTREEFSKTRRHNRATGLFKTDCPGGQFWDAVDGFCYSCPSGFGRTAYHVHNARACVRRIGEKVARATVVKKAECRTGEIKDLKIQGAQDSAAGGGCWTCPEAWDRTVFAIDGKQACEKGGGLEFKKAESKGALTCPAGQIFDFIGVGAVDFRTRPELKGKPVKPVASGTCWECPEGYDRTWDSVKAPTACIAKYMQWYSAPYEEPGLFGLKGAETALFDVTKNFPLLIQDSIKKTAEAMAKVNGKVDQTKYKKTFVDEQKLLLTSPEKSAAASSAVFVRIMAAIASPEKATAAEKELVNAFKSYIIAKRTYIATDALAAYDAWKKADDYQRANGPRGKTMAMLFDYGTVPPDFNTIAMVNSMGLGAVDFAMGQVVDKLVGDTLPILGDVLSLALAAGTNYEVFSDPRKLSEFAARTAIETAISKAAEFAVTKLAKSTAAALQNQIAQRLAGIATQKTIEMMGQRASQSVLSAAGSAGPQIIITASIMIASIAIDQVIEIANARPKLLTSIANAKYPPDLKRMAQTEDGVAELMGYWSQLSSGERPPGQQFRAAYPAVVNTAFAAKPAATKTATASKPAVNALKVTWMRLPGAAVDIGVGANGKAWHIGTGTESGGYGIYRLDGAKWTKIPGSGVRIAVDPKGNAWSVNKQGRIYRFDGRGWVQLPGAATDIGVGANGKVWVIGTNKEAGGYGIYRLDGNKWTKVPGSAVRIAVGPKGNAWVVNNRGAIYRFDGRKWAQMPGQARDIGIGAQGHIWHVGMNKVAGGYGLWRWNGKGWEAAPGGLTDLAVGPQGRVWGVNSGRQIYKMK
ncbi:MAG: tectonin domain-containing protein [Rhodospirillales bacterium]